MSNEKKCPHCGKWSKWSLSMDDKCEHCGNYLQEQERKKAKEKAILKDLEEKAFLFHINPDDSFIKRIFKRGGYAIYVVILSIASFLSWLLFWLGP